NVGPEPWVGSVTNVSANQKRSFLPTAIASSWTNDLGMDPRFGQINAGCTRPSDEIRPKPYELVLPISETHQRVPSGPFIMSVGFPWLSGTGIILSTLLFSRRPMSCPEVNQTVPRASTTREPGVCSPKVPGAPGTANK